MQKELFINKAKDFIRTHPALMAGATLMLGGVAIVEGNAFLNNSPDYPHLASIEDRKNTTQTIGIRDAETKPSDVSRAGMALTGVGGLMILGGALVERNGKIKKTK